MKAMKYSPKLYARALAEAASGELIPAREKKFVKNFIALIRRNGDWNLRKKILAETEKNLRSKTGRRKVAIETAREVEKSLDNNFEKFISASDIVERKINPTLIAGVKIIVNDTEEYDGSLKRKLDKLFS